MLMMQNFISKPKKTWSRITDETMTKGLWYFFINIFIFNYLLRL